MTIVEFCILTLAGSGVVDVLRNGSIFAEGREYAERRTLPPELREEEVDETGQPVVQNRLARLRTWLADRLIPTWACTLFICVFCLSYQAPFWLAMLAATDHWFPRVVVASFAAARAGNILNALLPRHARYFRPPWEPVDDHSKGPPDRTPDPTPPPDGGGGRAHAESLRRGL